MLNTEKVNKLFLIVVLVMFISCQRKAADMKSYVRYITDSKNGLKKSIVIGEFNYTIQYKTPYFVAIQENSKPVDKVKIRQRGESLKSTVWFNLSIALQSGTINPTKFGARNLSEYNQRLNYLLTVSQNDFEVFHGKERLKQTAFLFQNNYGIVPYDQFTLGYQLDKENNNEDILLVYHDQVFNRQPVRFLFSKEQLNKIPSLSL